VYLRVIQKNPRDPEAWFGLGEAQLAMDDYRSAGTAYESALRLEPADAEAERRLELVREVLALDPTLRGLPGTERYERSRRLLEAVSAQLSDCAAVANIRVPDPVLALQKRVREVLLNRSRPRSFGDAAEANLSLAQEVWQARIDLCGLPPDGATARILARLSR
jgi:tetratricopeptide (TPR) repeat protein